MYIIKKNIKIKKNIYIKGGLSCKSCNLVTFMPLKQGIVLL